MLRTASTEHNLGTLNMPLAMPTSLHCLQASPGTNLTALSICECPPRTTAEGTSANQTPECQTEYSK